MCRAHVFSTTHHTLASLYNAHWWGYESLTVIVLVLVQFMQIGRACESWQIYHKALASFMDLPALACKSNLHEPHQNKNHSLNELIFSIFTGKLPHTVSRHWIFDMLSLYKRLEPDKYEDQYPRYITTEIFTWYFHDATINVWMSVNTLCSSYNFDIWYVASSVDPLTPRFKFGKLCG